MQDARNVLMYDRNHRTMCWDPLHGQHHAQTGYTFASSISLGNSLIVQHERLGYRKGWARTAPKNQPLSRKPWGCIVATRHWSWCVNDQRSQFVVDREGDEVNMHAWVECCFPCWPKLSAPPFGSGFFSIFCEAVTTSIVRKPLYWEMQSIL